MAFRSHLGSQTGAWNYLRANAYNRVHAEESLDARCDNGPGFTIAISRDAGVEAGDVARAVGVRLGWPVWDHELLVAVAERMHSRAKDLTPVDETHVSWLQESLEMMLDMHAVSQIAYVHQLVKVVDELGEQGNCIVVGRGAAQLLPVDSTLRVRLVAPLESRVVAMCRITGTVNHAAALRKIEKLQRDRTRFVTDHFHADPTDPANYDLVLNVSRLSIDDCTQQIVDALHAEQTSRASRFHLHAPVPVARPA
jgi:cytidylate kinase